jgi:hypothetical protein
MKEDIKLILALSDSFRKLLSLRILASSKAFSPQRESNLTTHIDHDNRYLLAKITEFLTPVSLRNRPSVVRAHSVNGRAFNPNSVAPVI